MAKIIAVAQDIITIGTDDGSIKEVRIADLNFVPHIGDKVEIFETETRIIVSKAEEKTENPMGGININMTNNQNSQPQQLMLANGTKAVNKLVYCLLAFFLGSFGGHKFYAGKTGTGILFLLFCWTGIPTVVSIIEFIVGLCKKSDSNGLILV